MTTTDAAAAIHAYPTRVAIQLLDADLPAPRRAHPFDGAVDLHSRDTFTLAPGARHLAGTGIAVAVPAGWAGWVVPRSGLASRHGLSIVNSPGLVDAGYTGEVLVALVNLGSEPISIARGDRIAQLAFTPVLLVQMEVVEVLPGAQESSRGAGGFGSTGGLTVGAPSR